MSELEAERAQIMIQLNTQQPSSSSTTSSSSSGSNSERGSERGGADRIKMLEERLRRIETVKGLDARITEVKVRASLPSIYYTILCYHIHSCLPCILTIHVYSIYTYYIHKYLYAIEANA